MTCMFRRPGAAFARGAACVLGGALLLAPAWLAAQGAAGSTSVWRCGDGRYSATPCPGGVALDTADPRTAEQREQARAAAATDKRLAEQLAAERRARDQAGGQTAAVNLSASSAAAAAAAASASATAKKEAKDKPRSSRAKGKTGHTSPVKRPI